MLKEIFTMEHEEILALIFLILDQDGDSLISNHDLFKLCTLNYQ
jgi:hypothetical protein